MALGVCGNWLTLEALIGLQYHRIPDNHGDASVMKLPIIALSTLILCGASSVALSEVYVADGLAIEEISPDILDYLAARTLEEDPDNVAAPYVSHLVEGDIDEDGDQDVFLSYAIEGIGGGNLVLFFQALFINEAGALVFAAERDNGSFGTGDGKSYTPLEIQGNTIICETLAYGPDDAACCPSIAGEGLLVFEDGRLIEK